MKNHDLYLLVQRTIREHSPSSHVGGGTITIQGVKDNKSWAKHHKVVHVDPTYNVTLRKLRGKPVTIQLSQGNVSGADILKAVRRAYRGKNYSVTGSYPFRFPSLLYLLTVVAFFIFFCKEF